MVALQSREGSDTGRSIDRINIEPLYSRITVRGPAFNDCWTHTDCKHDGLIIFSNIHEIKCDNCGAIWKKIR